MTADTDRFLYEIDAQGFSVVRRALEPARVDQLVALAWGCRADARSGKFPIIDRGRAFVELAADARMVDRVRDLCGRGARLDVCFGLFMAKDAVVEENLHGGPRSEGGIMSYEHWGGRPFCGPLKVLYALAPAPADAGGLVCVPGTHRSSYTRPHWLQVGHPLVVQPELEAGDAVVFADSIVHGTRQWRMPYPRWALVYSYCPGWMAWRRYDPNWAALGQTDAEREILRGPYAATCDEERAAREGVWENTWRDGRPW